MTRLAITAACLWRRVIESRGPARRAVVDQPSSSDRLGRLAYGYFVINTNRRPRCRAVQANVCVNSLTGLRRTWRSRVRDSETVGKARCGLGGKLAAYRHAAGFSQAKFAALIDYSRSTIANVETGRQHVPRAFWASADTALHAGGALTEANDQMEAASQRERAAAAHAARDAGGTRVQCWRGRISWARRGTITAVRFRQHHLLAASLSTCARNWMMRYARAPWPRPASTTGNAQPFALAGQRGTARRVCSSAT